MVSSRCGPDIPGIRLNEFEAAAALPCLGGWAVETRTRGFLITLQVDVVDAHFAGLNTIHYLPKLLVFDLQCIADQ